MMVGLVNTYMVGHLGAVSLTSVGLADQVIMLVSSFFVAVSTGSTALIARCTGAKDPQRACRALQQSTLVAFAVGLVCTLFGVPLARQAMVWLGAADDVVALGADYLRIGSYSYALMALMFVGNGALRGAGDTRTPLIIMSIINVINVVVGYSLLHGLGPLPEMGVRGVAIGAATARSLGCAMVLTILIRGKANLKLRVGWPSLDWPIIRRLLDIGLPAGAEQVLMRLGQTAFAAIVASLGTAAYAAHQIAMTSSSIGFMPGFGFGVAATTLVGQALGAKDPKGAEEACRTAQRICMIMMGVIGLLIVVFARQLVGFFINDPEVIAAGVTCLRILGFIQPATAWMMVVSGGLRGAGDTRWTLIITAASVWLVRIPAGRLLGITLGMGLAGIWTAAGIDMVSRALLYDWRFRTGKWKNIRV
jgi:putative MATE family efflux protein